MLHPAALVLGEEEGDEAEADEDEAGEDDVGNEGDDVPGDDVPGDDVASGDDGAVDVEMGAEDELVAIGGVGRSVETV